MDPTLVLTVLIFAVLAFIVGRTWILFVPIGLALLAVVWTFAVARDAVSREGDSVLGFILYLIGIYALLAVGGAGLGLILRWVSSGHGRKASPR